MFNQSRRTTRSNRKAEAPHRPPKPAPSPSASRRAPSLRPSGVAPAEPPWDHAVVESIVWLKRRFTEMEDELRRAESEVTRLRRELSRVRLQHEAQVDVSHLRRRVAFYCHPDRGGDTELMARLNCMFDWVEALQRASAESELDRVA